MLDRKYKRRHSITWTNIKVSNQFDKRQRTMAGIYLYPSLPNGWNQELRTIYQDIYIAPYYDLIKAVQTWRLKQPE